jgi:death-on-curing protein
VFLALNGFDFTPKDDRARRIRAGGAAGESDDVDTLAATLLEWSRNGA